MAKIPFYGMAAVSIRARPVKSTVQKFIGDAIGHALKARQVPAGILTVTSLADQLTIQMPESTRL